MPCRIWLFFLAAAFVFTTFYLSRSTLSIDAYAQALLMLKIGLIVMILGGLFVAAAFSERIMLRLNSVS